MKRKIAAALAIIMVGAQYATPFVHAEETTEATVDVTGSSSVATLNDSVVKVVVPTTKALNFTLDPQGLLAIADGTVTSGKEADLKNYSGRILGNTALVFANKSIRPVTVTTNFQVDGVADAQVVSSQDAVKKPNSTTANLLFMAIPNKDAIKLSYGTGENASSSESLKDIDNHQTGNSFSGVAAAGGYVFTKTATTVKSVLPEAEHTISFTEADGTFDYTLDTSKGNSAAGFIISGFCNPYGDYSSVSNVSVKASYSFKKATTAESEANKIDSTFAVISAKQGTTDVNATAKNANGITTKSTLKAAVSSVSFPSSVDVTANTAFDVSYTDVTGDNGVKQFDKVQVAYTLADGTKGTADIVSNTDFLTIDTTNKKFKFTAVSATNLDDGSDVEVTYTTVGGEQKTVKFKINK